jgi:hypothetical protein
MSNEPNLEVTGHVEERKEANGEGEKRGRERKKEERGKREEEGKKEEEREGETEGTVLFPFMCTGFFPPNGHIYMHAKRV